MLRFLRGGAKGVGQDLDRRRVHAFGTDQTAGAVDHDVHPEFLDGRHVGKTLGAGAGEDGEQAQLAGLHHRRPARGLGGKIDLAAQQGAQGIGGTAIGRVRPLQAAIDQADALHGQMLGRADAQRAPVELAGVGLGIGDQLRQRFPRRFRAHHDTHHEAGDLQDVAQIVDRIVGQRLVEQRLAQHAHVHLGDRVAVGLLGLQRDRAEHARRAGLVLDHDRLAELLGRQFCQDAEAAVGRPARRPGNDQLDRPVGKLRLSPHDAGGGNDRGGGAGDQNAARDRTTFLHDRDSLSKLWR